MHSHRGFLAHPQTIVPALGAAVLFAVTSVLQPSGAGDVRAGVASRLLASRR